MIYYFSGTGNSEYVADRLKKGLKERSLSLNKLIKENIKIDVTDHRIIIVCPTNAWRIPRIVETWIKKTKFRYQTSMYFVMTCGSEIGNAAKYNKELCDSREIKYMGTAQIVMPENYIALFDVPNREEAKKIIADAEPIIDNVIATINDNLELDKPHTTLLGRAASKYVNPIFYSLFISDKKFTVTDKCISCGKCSYLCPTNNVKIVKGRPTWENEGYCIHCMACINNCPTCAIEYGKKSVGKNRYHFENN